MSKKKKRKKRSISAAGLVAGAIATGALIALNSSRDPRVGGDLVDAEGSPIDAWMFYAEDKTLGGSDRPTYGALNGATDEALTTLQAWLAQPAQRAMRGRLPQWLSPGTRVVRRRGDAVTQIVARDELTMLARPVFWSAVPPLTDAERTQRDVQLQRLSDELRAALNQRTGGDWTVFRSPFDTQVNGSTRWWYSGLADSTSRTREAPADSIILEPCENPQGPHAECQPNRLRNLAVWGAVLGVAGYAVVKTAEFVKQERWLRAINQSKAEEKKEEKKNDLSQWYRPSPITFSGVG